MGEGGGGTPLKEGEGDSRAFQGFLIGDFNQCFRCHGTP